MKYWLLILALSSLGFAETRTAHTRWNGHDADFWFVSNEKGQDVVQVRIARVDHIFYVPKGWMRGSNEEASTSRFRRRNLAKTNLMLQLPIGKRESLVFVTGPPIGSSPGGLLVLRLIGTKPVAILEKAELELVDLADLDGDGLAEIIGRPCYSQTIGDDIWTYDPLHVFQIEGQKAVLSVKLSQTYNQKHYAGWVGPECSEEYFVLPKRLAGGRRRIVSRAEAESFASKKKTNP